VHRLPRRDTSLVGVVEPLAICFSDECLAEFFECVVGEVDLEAVSVDDLRETPAAFARLVVRQVGVVCYLIGDLFEVRPCRRRLRV
jgi:hypothetical protein